MNKLNVIDLLRSGAAEIEALRKVATAQGEKLEIFYGMMRMTQLQENRGPQGMSEDIAYNMRGTAKILQNEFDSENVKSDRP